MKRVFLILWWGVASCTPALSRDTIRNHPKISLEIFQPQVVERSAPLEPAWVKHPERGAVGYVAFTGQSFAPTLDAGKAQAMRDLLSAVSSFISVEVESEFESTETAKHGGGENTETQDAKSSVKSRTAADLSGIQASEVYWEKVVASPLTPENVSYRVYVAARVPKATISKARLKKQLARQKTSGRKMVVVLPFRPAAEGGGPGLLANAFLEELSRRLADAPALHVGDAGLVQSLIGTDATTDAEAIEALSDAMIPDVVVGGTYQLHEGRLKVTYSVYQGGASNVLHTRSLIRPYSELFELEDELLRSVRKDLGAEAGSKPGGALAAPPKKIQTASFGSPPKDPALEAFEDYHQAFGLFQAGANEAALVQLVAAVELRPGYGEAHLRMGRVLERMGRYGKVPGAHSEALARPDWDLELCTDWSKISTEPRELFLAASEGRKPGEPSSWGAEKAANVDHLLSAVQFVLAGGPMPNPRVPVEPRSAIAAYYSAFRIAVESHDVRLRDEALLALGDLAVRVDRLARAERIYLEVYAAGEQAGDLHRMSLARYGLGIVRKNQGRYDEAASAFEEALAKRAVLGEKPYLLEIENELGGLMVEMGRYPAALAFFEKASRIAEDLDQQYFRAVLANNLGVLEYLRGRVSVAEAYFNQAWDYLSQIGEAEGEVSSGLNLGYLGAYKGDLERARWFLAETKRIVLETSQEGRLALHHNHQGFETLAEGRRMEGLRELLRSWALFRRLGRSVQDLRLRNNIAVTEYYHALDEAQAGDPGFARTVACLQRTYGSLLDRGFGIQLEGVEGYAPRSAEAPLVPPTNVVALIGQLNAQVLARIRR